MLRGYCLPNLEGSGCWLCVGAAESTISLLRSHRPPSGARNAAPKGRGRAQASGGGKGRAPSPLSRGIYCPHSARTPCPSDRRTGWACIGEDGPKRAACGREGTLPRKPRQLLSCSGANSPPVRQEGGLDVRPPSGEEAVRRSLTDGRGICRAYGKAPNPHITPKPLSNPPSRLQRASLPLHKGGFIDCLPGTRFPPAPFGQGRLG